jgi:hypothetical protein
MMQGDGGSQFAARVIIHFQKYGHFPVRESERGKEIRRARFEKLVASRASRAHPPLNFGPLTNGDRTRNIWVGGVFKTK